MSGSAGSALAEGAREVADDQPPAGPLQAPEQSGQADAWAARGMAFRDGQVLVGIDREAPRLHLIDPRARDQRAQLLRLLLLIGDPGERQDVQRRVQAAPLGEPDGLLDLLPAVPDRLVVRLIERLVRAVQADAAGVEPRIDQHRQILREGAIAVDVDRAAGRHLADPPDRLRDLAGPGERLALAPLAEGNHGAAPRLL